MEPQYPKPLKDRPEIDLRLGIKSSLPNMKQLLGAFFILPDFLNGIIEYSEEYQIQGKTKIRLNSKLEKDLRLKLGFFHKGKYEDGDREFNEFLEKLNQTPLFTAQLEPLQVALGTIYKLADISFVGEYSVTKERTGGHRYNKVIHFSLNVDLILKPFLDLEQGSSLVEIFKSWIEGKENKHQNLENILIHQLTILSEGTIFKIRDNNEEIKFQQEGILENLIQNIPTISKDQKEPVGPFRILKSIIKNDLHYYLNDKSSLFELKGADSNQYYYNKLQTTLKLQQAKEVIYMT